MKYSAWSKNNLREIKKTLARFIAIMAIIMLGVGFFSGLKVTRNAMLRTADNYISKANLFDFRLISTIGYDEASIEIIRNNSLVKKAEGIYSFDFAANTEFDYDNRAFKAYSLSDKINIPNIVSGRLPENDSECVVDARVYGSDIVGKTLNIVDDEEENSYTEKFKYKEYTIVGTVNSANYLNMERGTTTLLAGSLSGFVYFLPDAITMDYFTEILVKVDESSEIYSDEYKASIDNSKDIIEDVADKASIERYNSLYADAEAELLDAEQKYADGEKEYNEALDEFNTKIKDAEDELSSARKEIDDAKNKVAKGEKTLRESEIEYKKGVAKYKKGKAEFETKKTETEAALKAARTELDSKWNEFNTFVQNIPAEYLPLYQSQIDSARAELEAAEKEYSAKEAYAKEELAKAEKTLRDGKKALDKASQMITSGKSELKTAKEKIKDAEKEYEDGVKEFEEEKAKAEKELADAKEELADAAVKLSDARQELDDFKEPETFVLDRTTNVGYASFENDACIVEGISKVFPIFFFLVAALVCITTMTRMVDEHRVQIGTLKALGYSNARIAMKYIGYSSAAAVIGCAIGFFCGSKLFPWTIWKVYGILYNYFAPIEFVIDYKLAFLMLFVSLLCSAGATFMSCAKELRCMPAELMRPKAPKAGKKVFLEYIPFIWNHMKFLHKVSARNIFRFKKRMFMMLLGIGGCTALIVTGFGVKDSISNIAADQYDNIMKYDYMITLSDPLSDEEMLSFRDETAEELEKCVFINYETVDSIYEGGTRKVQVMATSDPDFESLFGLESNEKKVAFPHDGEAIISRKVANEAKVKIGDTLTIKISDTKTSDVKIAGIFKNYINDYMFMSENTYEDVFGKAIEYKNVIANAKPGKDIYKVSAELNKRDDVLNISISQDFKTRIKNMLSSLNYVVILVIACAMALAFVVLYNLSNINITERVREIATIKVLGFYAGETNSYVFRENIVLTIIGAIVGLPVGMLLHAYVMSNIKIDMVTFNIRVLPISYVYSLIFTIIMALVVDLVLIKKIQRINMAESLKSVE